jgi:hypothetical protein
MVQFSWVINQLNCLVQQDGLQDVINVIHWTYNANDIDETGKDWFASMYGTASVEQPNPQNFIPYPDVTEAEVIAWLEEVLPVSDMQANLIANIELQKHPIEVTLPLPWIPDPEPTTTTTTMAPEPTTTSTTTEAPI